MVSRKYHLGIFSKEKETWGLIWGGVRNKIMRILGRQFTSKETLSIGKKTSSQRICEVDAVPTCQTICAQEGPQKVPCFTTPLANSFPETPRGDDDVEEHGKVWVALHHFWCPSPWAQAANRSQGRASRMSHSNTGGQRPSWSRIAKKEEDGTPPRIHKYNINI